MLGHDCPYFLATRDAGSEDRSASPRRIQLAIPPESRAGIRNTSPESRPPVVRYSQATNPPFSRAPSRLHGGRRAIGAPGKWPLAAQGEYLFVRPSLGL